MKENEVFWTFVGLILKDLYVEPHKAKELDRDEQVRISGLSENNPEKNLPQEWIGVVSWLWDNGFVQRGIATMKDSRLRVEYSITDKGLAALGVRAEDQLTAGDRLVKEVGSNVLNETGRAVIQEIVSLAFKSLF